MSDDANWDGFFAIVGWILGLAVFLGLAFGAVKVIKWAWYA